MLYDLDIAPPPQTHRNTAAVKPQPEVTLRVKSFSLNLRSTVKVATMRLQGPHAIYRDLALCIPPPPPHPSFSPHLPTVSSHVLLKLFSLEATEWQTRSEVLQCDHKDVLFSVPAALSTLLHFFLSPGGNKWGQISSFLLCNLIRALTLDAAFRAGGESLEIRPSCRRVLLQCPLYYASGILNVVCKWNLYVCRPSAVCGRQIWLIKDCHNVINAAKKIHIYSNCDSFRWLDAQNIKLDLKLEQPDSHRKVYCINLFVEFLRFLFPSTLWYIKPRDHASTLFASMYLCARARAAARQSATEPQNVAPL